MAMIHATLKDLKRGADTLCSQTSVAAVHIRPCTPSSIINHRCLDPVTAVVNLVELANDLYCKGRQEDALSLYESALFYCKHPWNIAEEHCVKRIHQQLQWGSERLQGLSHEKDFLLVVQPDLPDAYQEDECDVGPRAFRLPVFPDAALLSSFFFFSSGSNSNDNSNNYCNTVMLYGEILKMYNTALLHHSRSEYGESMKLYEAVALALAKLIPHNVNTNTNSTTTALVLYHKLLELCMKVNNNMGQITYMLGLEETALEYFQAALAAANHRMADANNKIITHHPLMAPREAGEHNDLYLGYATILSNWCRSHWMSGDINAAVHQGLEEVLRIRSLILGWDHADVASAHFNLGVAEYARQHSDAALSHLFSFLQYVAKEAKDRKDLELRQQQQSSAAATTADAKPRSNNNQMTTLDPIPALVYILLLKNEHKNDEISQELVRGLRSLQEKRADIGPQGAEVASVLNFIGTLLFHQRDFEHALLFFQEELRLEENLVFSNKEDVSISVTCNNIGRILQELNRLPEAKHYYHRALKTHYGTRIEEWCSHPTGQEFCPLKWNDEHAKDLPHSTLQLYSAVWYNIALIHDKMGFYGKATSAFKVSLGLRRTMLGPNHPDISTLLYNVGVLLTEQHKLEEATASFKEALRIRQISPAPGHLSDYHVIQTLKKLASMHKAEGSISGALETLYEILNIQKISASSSTESEGNLLAMTRDVGLTMREIAELHLAEGRISEAVNMAQESIALCRRIQSAAGGTSDVVASTEDLVTGLLLLGSLNHENCESAKARQLFQEAADMIRQVSIHFPTSKQLDAMHEVTQILATCHCAPVA